MRPAGDPVLPISDLRAFARALAEHPTSGLPLKGCFDVHGTRFRVACDSQAVMDAFDLLLRFFRSPDAGVFELPEGLDKSEAKTGVEAKARAEAEAGAEVRGAAASPTGVGRAGLPGYSTIAARTAGPDVLRNCIPKGARSVTIPVEAGGTGQPETPASTATAVLRPSRHYQLGDIRYYDAGHGSVLALDPRSQAAVAYVDPSQSSGPEDIAGTVVLHILTQLLAARGSFLLPAAVAAYEESAIVLAGPPGCGKTTACVALIRSDFRFLSDTCAWVEYPGTGDARLMCFPACAKVYDATLQAFSELCSISPVATNLGTRLHTLFFDDIYPGCVTRSASPGLVLFPEEGKGAFHTVRPIPPVEAAARLSQECLALPDSMSRRRRQEALRALCGQSACYDLELGWDFPSLAPLIATLLSAQASHDA